MVFQIQTAPKSKQSKQLIKALARDFPLTLISENSYQVIAPNKDVFAVENWVKCYASEWFEGYVFGSFELGKLPIMVLSCDFLPSVYKKVLSI